MRIPWWSWLALPLGILLGIGFSRINGKASSNPQSSVNKPVVVSVPNDSTTVCSTPQWSPDEKIIAYIRGSKDHPETGDLYVAKYKDGKWQSAQKAQKAACPYWSPDGSRLAFNQGGLAYMDIDSDKIHSLLPDKSSTYYVPVSWSPNGQYLFCQNKSDKGIAGVIYDTISKTLIVLNTVNTTGLWTLDSKFLLCQNTNDNKVNLSLIDPILHEPLSADAGDINIADSADDKSVYLRNDKGIVRIDTSTGKTKLVISCKTDYLVMDPKGKHVAYLDKKTNALKVASVPDGKPRDIASSVSTRELRHQAHAFSWSPDGKQLVYTTDKGDIKIIQP